MVTSRTARIRINTYSTSQHSVRSTLSLRRHSKNFRRTARCCSMSPPMATIPIWRRRSSNPMISAAWKRTIGAMMRWTRPILHRPRRITPWERSPRLRWRWTHRHRQRPFPHRSRIATTSFRAISIRSCGNLSFWSSIATTASCFRICRIYSVNRSSRCFHPLNCPRYSTVREGFLRFGKARTPDIER